MLNKFKIGSLILVVAGCSESPPPAPTGSAGQAPSCPGGKCDTWGEDNRHEPYEYPRVFVDEYAQGVGVIVDDLRIRVNTDGSATMSRSTPTLGKARVLCEGEPFYDQPTMGYCSGFLAGNDIFVTAGHCLAGNNWSCEETHIVFGYGYWEPPEDPREAVKSIAKENHYQCKEVLLAEFCDDVYGYYKDFAVIRLDRPVEARQPPALRKEGQIQPGERLFMMGHPNGIPLKVSTDGVVKESYLTGALWEGEEVELARADGFFFDLEMFGSNSGGPVFNASTGIVEGIAHAYSGQDWVLDPSHDNTCVTLGRCGVNIECPVWAGAYPVTEYAEFIGQAVNGASREQLEALPRDYACPPPVTESDAGLDGDASESDAGLDGDAAEPDSALP